MYNVLGKIKIAAAALIVFALMGSALPVQALDDHDRDRKCEQRIHRAEENLRNAERRHGEHSRQAEQKRRQLEEARERCRHHDRDHDHH
jgi:hypothetical protein